MPPLKHACLDGTREKLASDSSLTKAGGWANVDEVISQTEFFTRVIATDSKRTTPVWAWAMLVSTGIYAQEARMRQIWRSTLMQTVANNYSCLQWQEFPRYSGKTVVHKQIFCFLNISTISSYLWVIFNWTLKLDQNFVTSTQALLRCEPICSKQMTQNRKTRIRWWFISNSKSASNPNIKANQSQPIQTKPGFA